jgi:radical SAM protein with 4Fe4S-binding SPASM domain
MAPFESFPFVISWELTLACDLRCRHCNSSAGMPRPRELDAAAALALCDQFPPLLVREVDFTGGEPLRCPYWETLAERLRDLHISVKVLTNGWGLDGAAVGRFQSLGIESVGISIDGLDATHDYLRGAGSFRRAVAAVGRLNAAWIPVTVITTVHSRNVAELSALAAVILTLGVTNWQVQPILRFGRAAAENNLALTPEQYLALGRFVRTWRPRAAAAGMSLSPADSFGYFTAYDDREPPWMGCGGGVVSLGITSDGRVKPCLSLPDEFAVGDVRERDLRDLWFHGEGFAAARASGPDRLGTNCRTCGRAGLCRGGCAAMSYSYTGAVHNDPFCFLALKAS